MREMVILDVQDGGEISCAKCASTQITTKKRGLHVTRTVIGVIVILICTYGIHYYRYQAYHTPVLRLLMSTNPGGHTARTYNPPERHDVMFVFIATVVGLAAGAVGMNQMRIVCLKCGAEWNPGEPQPPQMEGE